MSSAARASAWSSPLLAALGQAVSDRGLEPDHPAFMGAGVSIIPPFVEIMYRGKMTADPEGSAVVTDLEGRLRAVVAAERDAAAQHDRAKAARDAAFLAAVESGLTYYKIRQATGMAQSAVAKSVQRARNQKGEALPPVGE